VWHGCAPVSQLGFQPHTEYFVVWALRRFTEDLIHSNSRRWLTALTKRVDAPSATHARAWLGRHTSSSARRSSAIGTSSYVRLCTGLHGPWGLCGRQFNASLSVCCSRTVRRVTLGTLRRGNGKRDAGDSLLMTRPAARAPWRETPSLRSLDTSNICPASQAGRRTTARSSSARLGAEPTQLDSLA
jgi:hypothetical protein